MGKCTQDAWAIVIKNLYVTRHLKGWKEWKVSVVAALARDVVMAQTGLETGEIVEGIVKRFMDCANCNLMRSGYKFRKRLNGTIQISNTGIAPGSG